MDSNFELIKGAIMKKLQVIGNYKGFRREMCPHVMGMKNGSMRALFYQFGGESSSGLIVPDSPQNWRCIPMDGLTDVSVREGKWFTASNHSRPQTCIDKVLAEVSF